MSTLVGRNKEIAALTETLTALESGQGGTLFFTGEPGIGKSALARWLAESAKSQSLPVYWGFCWEAGGAPAYWPWTQSLRSLVAEQDIPGSLLARLAQLLPEVAEGGTEPELQPEQARFLLLESTRLVLEHASRERPLVLVFEDLHAADSDSLSLLHYLARHANSMPVLLVGTYRELEAKQSATTDALWRATRDADVQRLSPLDEDAVLEFLEATGNESSSSERAKELLATTEGNPLFLTELVNLIGKNLDSKLPETVQQVIGQQIDLLPAKTVTTLAQASVLGREFDTCALAALRNQVDADTELEVEPAAAAALIHSVRPGRYRFSHALHRDVLYRGLDVTTRQDLHHRCAAYFRTLIDAGDEDRWTLYATHLQAAGSDYKNEAIAAWEKSAVRAHARLAFDDAAQSMKNALEAFGEGPRFNPIERCELQIRCALAMQLAGDIEQGQSHCREAFATARTLEDLTLMAEAALTYGNALVVAHIDKELVAMLRECLEVLPDSNNACRARVQARLAAALQPAVDPSAPVRMALEAIALARTIDDESVLFSVLRSAISALMDFAPAPDRVPLNREFGTLAERLGNTAEQFRSYLRLMVDAVEIADRQLFDESIDAAEQIATRIGLPHFLWRTSSMRATQAIAEGRFAQALTLIDQAQALADRAGVIEALVTLPLQRFAILTDWDDERAPPIEEVKAQLQHAYASGMAEAEFFVAPLIATYASKDSTTGARELLANKSFVERSFKGEDRVTIPTIGESAAQLGDIEVAQRAYDRILPRAAECCSLGLMGGGIFWPVALSLGNIARDLGRLAEAQNHFENSLRLAIEMRALPLQSRIYAKLADIEAARGNESDAQAHRRAALDLAHTLQLRDVAIAQSSTQDMETGAPEERFEMQLEGDIRTIRFDNETTSLRDNKGLQLLQRLVAQPGQEIHVLDLMGASQGSAGDAGPQLDDKARAEYQQRVTELQDGLEEAQTLGDAGAADALREELDFITRELSRAYGLGGRERRASSAAERARVNVRRRLKDAIERIGQPLPDAARYLENTIKTGSYCKYTPM